MKTGAYISIILTALLISGILHVALAQDIVAGVKPGDSFTYTVTGSYSSNAPIADVPEEVLSAEGSEFFRVTIVNVSNPVIGYTYEWRFLNGTDKTGDGVVNIEIPSESVGPFTLVVTANLTTNDSIHRHFGPRSTFNETVMYAYSNYTRETNRWLTESAEANNETDVIKYRTVTRDTYFDKITGMLVQFNEQVSYQNPAFTTEITWKLLGQTAWTFSSAGSYPPAPFFTLPVIVALAVVVAVVVVVAGFFVSNRRAVARRKALLRKK